MKKEVQNEYGFTLIELMVVVGIIAILTAIAVPSLKPWVQESRLRYAANDLAREIQFAKMMAISRGRPCGVIFFDSPDTPGGAYCRCCDEPVGTNDTVQDMDNTFRFMNFNRVGRESYFGWVNIQSVNNLPSPPDFTPLATDLCPSDMVDHYQKRGFEIQSEQPRLVFSPMGTVVNANIQGDSVDLVMRRFARPRGESTAIAGERLVRVFSRNNAQGQKSGIPIVSGEKKP